MEKYKESFIRLIKNKGFIITVIIVAVASYGYLLEHCTVNIDTLSGDRYYKGGDLIAQGRLLGPVIDKIFNVMNYYPFFADFIAVIFLIISAVLYCTLFDVVSKGKVKMISYTIFACFFISYPLIMEVMPFIPMGISIGLGFCLVALSLIAYNECLITKKVSLFIFSIITLFGAISLYESFAVVYIIGVLASMLLKILFGSDEKIKLGQNIFNGLLYIIPLCIAIMLSFVLPVLILKCTNIHTTSRPDKISMYKDLGFIGGLKNFVNTVIMNYFINALGYLPITFLVIGIIVSIIMGIVLSIKRKNCSIFLVILGMNVSLFLLSLIQAKSSYYRACQQFQLFVAFIFMVLTQLMLTIDMKKCLRYSFIFIMFFMIFYQVKETYKWQFINDIRYQKEKSDMTILAHELVSNYDVENKPVVFCGCYIPAKIILDEVFINKDSFHYKVLEWYCKNFYPENLENVDYYHVVETSMFSYVLWSVDAFYPEETANSELLKFFKYLGYEFKPGSIDMYEKAKSMVTDENIPVWPKNGSIVDTGEFICIHFYRK